jgi:hypothetical protein
MNGGANAPKLEQRRRVGFGEFLFDTPQLAAGRFIMKTPPDAGEVYWQSSPVPPEFGGISVQCLVSCGLYPNVVFRREITASVTSVYRTCRFDKHYFAFLFGEWFVLHSLRNHKHLACLQVNFAVTELDAHFSTQSYENLVRISVAMPDKVALELNQFETVIIHLGNYFW